MMKVHSSHACTLSSDTGTLPMRGSIVERRTLEDLCCISQLGGNNLGDLARTILVMTLRAQASTALRSRGLMFAQALGTVRYVLCEEPAKQEACWDGSPEAPPGQDGHGELAGRVHRVVGEAQLGDDRLHGPVDHVEAHGNVPQELEGATAEEPRSQGSLMVVGAEGPNQLVLEHGGEHLLHGAEQDDQVWPATVPAQHHASKAGESHAAAQGVHAARGAVPEDSPSPGALLSLRLHTDARRLWFAPAESLLLVVQHGVHTARAHNEEREGVRRPDPGKEVRILGADVQKGSA
mmetsp:Transcript_94745/g.277152  ORF Transcript_94745/g.277152 Transcript_94745/m.277152 type:complete len:293 (+) Transcript_94745:272-1150(+)